MPGGQADEHDPGLHGEGQRSNAGRLVAGDGLDGDGVDVGPWLHNVGVGGPLCIYQWLKVRFSKPHPQRPMAFRAPTLPS